MAEPQVLSTLKRKQTNIQSYIRDLEKRLTQARHDLAHVNATIRLFEIGDGQPQFPVYASFRGLYRKGELTKLCLEALGKLPERTGTSREIAEYIIAQKGWDGSDKALRTAVARSAVSTTAKPVAAEPCREAGEAGRGGSVAGEHEANRPRN